MVDSGPSGTIQSSVVRLAGDTAADAVDDVAAVVCARSEWAWPVKQRAAGRRRCGSGGTVRFGPRDVGMIGGIVAWVDREIVVMQHRQTKEGVERDRLGRVRLPWFRQRWPRSIPGRRPTLRRRRVVVQRLALLDMNEVPLFRGGGGRGSPRQRPPTSASSVQRSCGRSAACLAAPSRYPVVGIGWPHPLRKDWLTPPKGR